MIVSIIVIFNIHYYYYYRWQRLISFRFNDHGVKTKYAVLFRLFGGTQHGRAFKRKVSACVELINDHDHPNERGVKVLAFTSFRHGDILLQEK